ncbi:hypothetical protein C8F01DRAFT_1290424 [Mycena amicta]|nr:hypothetical protein C8F01DRAFT_1290424 [Mycena amicta]
MSGGETHYQQYPAYGQTSHPTLRAPLGLSNVALHQTAIMNNDENATVITVDDLDPLQLKQNNIRYQQEIRRLEARNLQLASQNEQLARHNEQLARQNEQHATQNLVLIQSNSTLLSLIQNQPSVAPSTHSSNTEVPLPPPQIDLRHANKLFWTQASFNNKVNTHEYTNEPTRRLFTKSSLLFATDQHGNLPEPSITVEIKSVSQGILTDMANTQLLPLSDHTYGSLGQTAKDTFRSRLENRFLCLRYCTMHWKADAVATVVYNNWKMSRSLANKTIKKEISAEEDDDDEPLRPRAKSRSTSSGSAARTHGKKRNVDDEPLSEVPLKKLSTGSAAVDTDSNMDDFAAPAPAAPRQKKTKPTSIQNPLFADVETNTATTKSRHAPASAPPSTASRSSSRAPTIGKPASTSSLPKAQHKEPVASSSRKRLTPIHSEDEDDAGDGHYSATTFATIGSPPAGSPKSTAKAANKSGQAPAPVVSVPVAPADLSQAPAEAPTKPKRSATWKPSYKSIAQQLCAQHWLQTHGKGKKKDFELFWDELTAAQKNVRVVLLIQVWYQKEDAVKAERNAQVLAPQDVLGSNSASKLATSSTAAFRVIRCLIGRRLRLVVSGGTLWAVPQAIINHLQSTTNHCTSCRLRSYFCRCAPVGQGRRRRQVWGLVILAVARNPADGGRHGTTLTTSMTTAYIDDRPLTNDSQRQLRAPRTEDRDLAVLSSEHITGPEACYNSTLVEYDERSVDGSERAHQITLQVLLAQLEHPSNIDRSSIDEQRRTPMGIIASALAVLTNQRRLRSPTSHTHLSRLQDTKLALRLSEVTLGQYSASTTYGPSQVKTMWKGGGKWGEAQCGCAPSVDKKWWVDWVADDRRECRAERQALGRGESGRARTVTKRHHRLYSRDVDAFFIDGANDATTDERSRTTVPVWIRRDDLASAGLLPPTIATD